METYILLTKREGRTGRISARGLDSTDRAQRGPYKKDRGSKFSHYGPEQDWLIRDLLHDWGKQRLQRRKCGIIRTMPGPILREYWTGNRAFWLVDFSYWPSDWLSRVIKGFIDWSTSKFLSSYHLDYRSLACLVFQCYCILFLCYSTLLRLS